MFDRGARPRGAAGGRMVCRGPAASANGSWRPAPTPAGGQSPPAAGGQRHRHARGVAQVFARTSTVSSRQISPAQTTPAACSALTRRIAAAIAALIVLVLPAGAAAATGAPARVTAWGPANGSCPWVRSGQPIARKVASVLSKMTLADEITLVEGHGTNNPYLFFMPGIARLCVPALAEEDGPSGVGDGLKGVTQLPAGVALAASWDPSLARDYGEVVGAEVAGKGANVDLGPTVNIDRDPRWGRSFETYSEDPFLSAALATATIDGVQHTGVMSQVKHFAAYNQETKRNTSSDDVIVSERALRELYLPSFEAAVEHAKVASVMCAYSIVNGSFSCDSRDLLADTLKRQWGFDGFVTSDYGALHDTVQAAQVTDQEQPLDTYFGAALQAAVQAVRIPRAVLNTMVTRILTEMFRFGLFDKPASGSTSAVVTSAAHRKVANEIAQDAATLLKNAGGILPLASRRGGTVAVIGPSASVSPADAGGGSAYVIGSQTVTPLAGIQAGTGTSTSTSTATRTSAGTRIVYQQGLPADSSLATIPSSALAPAYTPTSFAGTYSATLTAPETGTYVLALTNPCGCYTPSYLYLDGQELLDNPGTAPAYVYSAAVDLHAGQRYSIEISGESSDLTWATPSELAQWIAQAAAAARSASTAVVVVSDDTESEASDRLTLELPSAQDQLIAAVAAANPRTIVVIDAGAPVAMPWLNRVAAVIDAWYPGQTNGTALANVLFGAVDPSGHLPVTFPASIAQVPAASASRFPGNGGKVHYSEGVDVGYRWYDARGIAPLFAFGYGLSYTRFAFSSLHVTPASATATSDVEVTAMIRNIGRRAGADVAQLYLGDPAGAGEPRRQLVGFQKVSLVPGQSAKLRFTVTPRDTWWWDQTAGGWSQTQGTYHLYAGDSSALANLPLRGSFTIDATPAARRVLIHAPRTLRPGHRSRVGVTLTASGNATLARVALSLQVPQGWTVTPTRPTISHAVAPSRNATATFSVRPPAWAPATNDVLHASASLGADAVREAGVIVRLS